MNVLDATFVTLKVQNCLVLNYTSAKGI